MVTPMSWLLVGYVYLKLTKMRQGVGNSAGLVVGLITKYSLEIVGFATCQAWI